MFLYLDSGWPATLLFGYMTTQQKGNINIFYIVAFITLTLCPLASQSKSLTLNTTLKKLKLPFYSTLPILVKNTLVKKKSHFRTVHIKAKYKGTQIEMDVQNKATIQQFKNLSFTYKILKSLYLPRSTPYRGAFSNIQKCKTIFLPTQKHYTVFSRKNLVFVAGVNNRNTFGQCANVKIYGAYTLIYFRKKKYIIQLRLFAALNKHKVRFKNIFKSFYEK